MNGRTSKPVLSVITVCLNAGDTIARTLASYRDQLEVDCELIVVDGGSTDSTPAIIDRYSDSIDVLIREPDNGIADAMNKGLSSSRGEYLLFLHADDYLVDAQVLKRASVCFNGQTEILAFDLLHGSGERLSPRRSRPFSHNCRFKTPFWHQATFCHRKLFERIGEFDPLFKVCMDYDFFLRAFLAGATCLRVHQTTTVMSDKGLSSKRDWASVSARLEEEFQVQLKNRQSSIELLWYWPWWKLYPIYKRLRVAFW